MQKKITVEELYKLMQDPKTRRSEIAKYFIVDQERSRFFNPAITYNTDLVDTGATAGARARSEAALPFLNGVERAKRHAVFELKRIGGYSGPIIVSEGDSWFEFPIILADVIDDVSDIYAVSSLDAAGDTLDQMLEQDEYMDEIHRVSASILLFSGGGNDVLGGGDLKSHLRPYDPVRNPAQHIKSSFNGLLNHTIGLFDQIYRRVAREAPDVHVITHGYDYVVPNSGKWLGQPMEQLGIADKTFQKAIAAELIDRFAVAMLQLAKRYSHVHFLDNRRTVTAAEWYDELHPRDSGFKKIADAFAKKILEIAPKPRARGMKAAPALGASRRTIAAPANKGLSLHIGLNKIDPAHYGSECELFGCHNDAKDMAAIAKDRGYEPIDVLLDQDAKAKALRDKVEKAAKTLKAGDIFLLTYSGHGGSVPDFSGDETDDGQDETLCLFDRQLIDDELYEFWSWFAEGVRVLVVSDSCHSGTVIRATVNGLVTVDPSSPGAFPHRVRLLPTAARRYAISNHRELYKEVAAQTDTRRAGELEQKMRSREIDNPLACTVRLLSGCLDSQTSADGDLNGLFTSRLMQVLENGFTGDYAKFHQEIKKLMPDNQTPNHWVIGHKDPGFDSQRPFEL